MVNVNVSDVGGGEAALPRVPVNPPLPQPTAPPVGFESDLPEPPQLERRESAPVRRGPDPKDLETLNKLMEGLGHRLEFGLYPSTDEFFVKVVDRSSNRVVKVIPQQELLELSQKLTESLGLFLDRNV